MAHVGDSAALLDTGAEVVGLTAGKPHAAACRGCGGATTAELCQLRRGAWGRCATPCHAVKTAPNRLFTARPPAEHRIGDSPSELARLEAAGGRLSRLNQYGSGPSCGAHEGVGPVRLWPGGIMVSRAIGDRDVGAILLPHPHIRQVTAGRLGAG